MALLTRYIEQNSPRQAEIAEHVRSLIVSGKLCPGAQIPTVAQLVEQFNASNKTVQGAISHLRETGFICTQRWRGSYVTDPPPHLRHVGVVLGIPTEKSIFHQTFRAEVNNWLKREKCEGWRFSYYDWPLGGAEPEIKRSLFDAIETRQLAALIFMAPQDTSAFESLPELPFKVSTWKTPGAVYVDIDMNAFYAKALDYLRERGRQRIAFVNVYKEDTPRTAYDRLAPVVEAHSMITHHRWIHGGTLQNKVWAANAAELMMHCSRRDRPDGIVIADDNFVPEVTAALAEAGVNIPGDLEIVAHANFPRPTPSVVPAVRLGFDVRYLLETFISLIVRNQKGEEIPDRVLIEPVFERDSESGREA